MNAPRPPVVIKVGGSLLARRGLPEALAGLRDHPTVADAATRVWIAGGGDAVEALRRVDAANPVNAMTSHWAAVDVMDRNARVLADWLPWATPTRDWRRIGGEGSPDWVFAVGDFLQRAEPSLGGRSLPVGWEVTSDSIAARVAEALSARLILLKSAPPTAEIARETAVDWVAAADLGYVDRHFPAAASALGGVEVFEAVSDEVDPATIRFFRRI